VAQALLKSEKIAIIKQRFLTCTAPYALEGMIRRELEAAGAMLENVAHGDDVRFEFSLPDTDAEILIFRLNESGHGRITWIASDLA